MNESPNWKSLSSLNTPDSIGFRSSIRSDSFYDGNKVFSLIGRECQPAFSSAFDEGRLRRKASSSNLRFPWILALGIWILASPALCAEALPAAVGSEVSFDFISALFVFMLATFVGLDVIRRVSRLLHTPLMSLTNAISAIAVVGAILVAGPEHPTVIHWMGLVAVVASVTNIVSGFLITDRMLKMFKKKEEIKAK